VRNKYIEQLQENKNSPQGTYKQYTIQHSKCITPLLYVDRSQRKKINTALPTIKIVELFW